MDHIAHLLAWAIERGATAANVLDLPFYHPTLEEGLKPALRQICEIVEEPELKRFDDIGSQYFHRDRMAPASAVSIYSE
jgi:dihydrolipoamide dehydrogenase